MPPGRISELGEQRDDEARKEVARGRKREGGKNSRLGRRGEARLFPSICYAACSPNNIN